jgi:hypothetical protein
LQYLYLASEQCGDMLQLQQQRLCWKSSRHCLLFLLLWLPDLHDHGLDFLPHL